MKKLLFTLVLVFALSASVFSQDCNFYVDTIQKQGTCGDSVQLSSSFCISDTTYESNELKSICFTSADVGYIAGLSGTLLKTINAGKTWTAITIPTNTYNFYSIYFKDTQTGYALGEDYMVGPEGVILKTKDAGNTWKPYYCNGFTAHSVFFTNDTTGIMVGNTEPMGAITRTTDGGKTWSKLIVPTFCNNGALYSVHFTDEQTGYAAGRADWDIKGSKAIIIKTTDAGKTWSLLNNITPRTGFNSFYFTDPLTCYAVGFEIIDNAYQGLIVKTTDAWKTWTKYPVSIPNYLFSVNFTDANTGFIAGDGGIVYKTTDAGNTWTILKTGTSKSLYAAYFTDSKTGYVLTNNLIIKLSDIDNATYSWQPTSGVGHPNAPVTKVSFPHDITYEVTINPNSGTGCSAYTNNTLVKMVPLTAPEICMVSIRNNKNIVIWNKAASSSIDSYDIWRETTTTDVYEKIGTTLYSDSSIFIDVTSNPLIQSNKYQISIKDICNKESEKSAAHKTMHLSINQGTGTSWNLIWEAYAGYTVSTYKIYRGTTADNLSLIGSTSGSNTQYSDFTAPAGYVYYQIQAINPNQCNPTKSNKYNSSQSNISTNNPSYNSVNELNKNGTYISLSPNPANDKIYIEYKGGFNGEYLVRIYNINGELIMEDRSQNKSRMEMDVSALTKGVYFVKIETREGVESRKLVKM